MCRRSLWCKTAVVHTGEKRGDSRSVAEIGGMWQPIRETADAQNSQNALVCPHTPAQSVFSEENSSSD